MTAQRAKRILLVEDHAHSLEMQAFILRRHGHEVTTASTAEEARLAASRSDLDLVVCDLGLPDGDGYGLMQELHRKFSLNGIALSGARPERHGDGELPAGFVSHLVKPLSPEELVAAVDVMS